MSELTFQQWEDRKALNAENKRKLRRVFINKSHNGYEPYVKPKTEEKESFTKKLRNKKGYDKSLIGRFKH